ncbi:helix-turn-helix transcriptional regulator [Nocardiopsis sp. NPDC006198]|uniref:helix-turn-helix domain-containing protein n=1 Tax=Nocardiopsis sp. NPDC006198 TaxID=3154472 RepID=UPI0033AD9C59
MSDLVGRQMCPVCAKSRCVCIPDGFWDDPAMVEAAREGDLRTLLRALNQRGLSQRELAALTGLGQTTVGGTIRGVRKVTKAHMIADAIAGLAPPPAPPEREDPDRSPAMAWDGPAPALAPPVHTDPMEALGLHSAGLVRHGDSGPVGSWSTGMVYEQLRDLADRYLAAPLTEIAADLAQLSGQLEEWRHHRLPLTVACDLWVLSGWRSALASWLSVDRTRPDHAVAHARAAQVAAHESGHEGIATWALMCLRTVAYWQQRRGRAAEFAEQAWHKAQAVGGGAAVITASALAQDLAVQGRVDRAMELIQVARRALENEPTQDSDLGGPLACELPRATGYWAETYLSLGEAGLAVDCAREGLDVGRRSWVRNLGSERMLTLHLATGLVQQGQVEEAMNEVAPLLELEPALRARPLVLKLEQFGRALPLAGETSTMREHIRAFADL